MIKLQTSFCVTLFLHIYMLYQWITISAVLLRNLLSLALMHEARILLSKQMFSSKTQNKMQSHYYSYCAILWNFELDIS